jgi:hypothetical protein|tara:strand:+ start:103 stop:324 length:222 start_codon:yes stop_codon:yes gene_type:complete
MDDLKSQVDRLEWRIDLHEEQLRTLTANAEELRNMLDSINRTLLQIKWLAVGGACVYWAQEMGLGEFIKVVGG